MTCIPTAAFMNVSVVYDEEVRTKNPLAPILTVTVDLLHANSYCHRDSMKYASRLLANQVLIRRDAYFAQSSFAEKYNRSA